MLFDKIFRSFMLIIRNLGRIKIAQIPLHQKLIKSSRDIRPLHVLAHGSVLFGRSAVVWIAHEVDYRLVFRWDGHRSATN